MSIIEVKTTDLSGAALDWAVAKIEGYDLMRHPFRRAFIEGVGHVDYRPSTDWAVGGPLIERYRAYPMRYDDTAGVTESNRFFVMAEMEVLKFGDVFDVIEGPTPLVAACRAIVAAKLGETVKVPKELMP